MTKLFQKPWGIPEYLILALAVVMVDFFTPNTPLLPFFDAWAEAIVSWVKGLVP